MFQGQSSLFVLVLGTFHILTLVVSSNTLRQLADKKCALVLKIKQIVVHLNTILGLWSIGISFIFRRFTYNCDRHLQCTAALHLVDNWNGLRRRIAFYNRFVALWRQI